MHVQPSSGARSTALHLKLPLVPYNNELPRDKTNNMTVHPASSEDSDQPGHPTSLIRVFAVRPMGSLRPKLSARGQRRL